MNDEYMKLAIKEAKKAYRKDEIPVGAVIVKKNVIIAKAHNKKTLSKNVLDHAELIAIQKAAKQIGDWRLDDCDIYVTLEPCPMCASAIQQSRIKNVYIGVKSKNLETHQIVKRILESNNYNSSVNYQYIDDLKCADLLTSFFKNKR